MILQQVQLYKSLGIQCLKLLAWLVTHFLTIWRICRLLSAPTLLQAKNIYNYNVADHCFIFIVKLLQWYLSDLKTSMHINVLVKMFVCCRVNLNPQKWFLAFFVFIWVFMIYYFRFVTLLDSVLPYIVPTWEYSIGSVTSVKVLLWYTFIHR